MVVQGHLSVIRRARLIISVLCIFRTTIMCKIASIQFLITHILVSVCFKINHCKAGKQRLDTVNTSKVLFTRQNITEIKEEELRIQTQIALANRKERQYRIAITSNAICTFDFNLTKDLIEEDVVQTKES